MPTRNVVLTDHQSELIERLVASGRYQNASEVLREGLRLIERRDSEDEARLAALRAAVQVGIDDIEAGRYQTFDNADALADYLTRMTDEVLSERQAKRA
jgi:antitoxin ParD1/3/4